MNKKLVRIVKKHIVSPEDVVTQLQKKTTAQDPDVKIAGKLKKYIKRRREEKKMYSGGRAPRPITAKTAIGTLIQLSRGR